MEDSGHTAPAAGSDGHSDAASIDELMGKSPRALAIAGLAWLEGGVREAAGKLMARQDKQLKALVGDEDSKGELSFSYQCRLLYCLGLIGPNTLSDFSTVARIRNKFGHRQKANTFATPEIYLACESL